MFKKVFKLLKKLLKKAQIPSNSEAISPERCLDLQNAKKIEFLNGICINHKNKRHSPGFSSRKTTNLSFILVLILEFFLRNYAALAHSILLVLSYRSETSNFFKIGYLYSLVFHLIFDVYRNVKWEKKRAILDSRQNNKEITVVTSSKENHYSTKFWKDLKCGDIILLKKNEESPADVLILDSREDFCFVDEKKVNESSQLVLKKPIALTSIERLSKFKGRVSHILKKLKGYLFIEKMPKSSVTFRGSLKLHNDPKVEILDENNLIYRGSILKYSDWVFGVVVYAGNETKLAKNRKIFGWQRKKYFHSILNHFILIMVLIQIGISLLGLVLEQFSNHYYKDQFQSLFREKNFDVYLLNFSCLIPFNLYYFLEIFDFFYVSAYDFDEKIHINNPNFFQNFASINYAVLNKNSLSYPDQYKIKGAIINEKFFKIKEKHLENLSLETIKEVYTGVHRKKTEDELVLRAKKTLEKRPSLQLPSSRSLQEIDQPKHFSNSEVESSPLELHLSQMKSISRSNFVNSMNGSKKSSTNSIQTIRFLDGSDPSRRLSIQDIEVKGLKPPKITPKKKITFSKDVFDFDESSSNFSPLNIPKERYKDEGKNQRIFSKFRLDSKKSIVMNDFVSQVNSKKIDVDGFCRALILCHGTRTKLKEQTLNYDHITHEDEFLQSFAKKCGYSFEANLMMAKRNCYKINVHGFIEYYPILSVHHGTINRQRFSILFELNSKFNHGETGGLLYVKGSFRHMQGCLRLKNAERDNLKNVCLALENMGYEVIIYAKKELNLEEMSECIKKFDMARTNLTIDDEELENLYSALEQNSSFLTLICVEERLKEDIKPFVQNLRATGLNIGVFSGDSLIRTLAVIQKAKIIDSSKEIMVLEGDSPERILAGIQALLDHINKIIKRNLEIKEDEKGAISPNKFKEYFSKKRFSFDYFLMFHSSALEIIHKNPYLLRHVRFLVNFADGVFGYELNARQKVILIKIIKRLPGKSNVLVIGNSHSDERIMDLSACSIEENLPGQTATQNNGDLLVSNLRDINRLLFRTTQEYIDIMAILISNLVYMVFLLCWPYVFFVIYLGLNPESLYRVCTYENLCIFIVWVEYVFESSYFREDHFFVVAMNQKMLQGLIFNNVIMAFFDGGLLFLFSLMSQNENFEILFLIFVIMSLKLYLNSRLGLKIFILMTFCNFLLFIVFLMLGTCFGASLFQPPQEIHFFFISFLTFLKDNCLSIILMLSFLVINHFLFEFIIVKTSSNEDPKSRQESCKGTDILKTLRELFQHQESEILIKEIEENLDPCLNQINFKDCEMGPFTLEFKNTDIEEGYIEYQRKRAFASQKGLSILMALFLFGFNYFSNNGFQTQLLPFYLIHSYADLLFVFGFLLFIEGNLSYYPYFKKSVILIGSVLWLMIVFSSLEFFCNEKLMYLYVMVILYHSILIPRVWFFIVNTMLYVSVLFCKFAFINSGRNNSHILCQEILILFFSILVFLNSFFQTHYTTRKQFSEAKTLEIEEKKVNDFLSILVPKFVKYLMTQGIFSLSQPQNEVSVLFCDICYFDEIIANQNRDIVTILDHIYRIFDGFCLQYGVQKIETVGKTYMACAGLTQCELHYDTVSESKQGNSTFRLLKVAFEMKKFTQPLTYGKGDKNIQLKIGIHHGSVIAGVIGHHKPQFSLIGDTINTTSRLCSTGRDGKIILSDKAYHYLKLHQNFKNLTFLERKVDAKGKGELMTYEVKKAKKQSFKKSPKKPRRSPLEALKHSFESAVNRHVRKMRLFEDILQMSESPSDLNVSSPTPTILMKSMSSQIDVSSLLPGSHSQLSEKKLLKIPMEDLEIKRLSSEIEKKSATGKMPQLKLNLCKESRIFWPFTPKASIISRMNPLISPNHRKLMRTPDRLSPSSFTDPHIFSFFTKEVGLKSVQEFDSDDQQRTKLSSRPECIKEEEEIPSDFSPEIVSNQKSLKSEDTLNMVEEWEYQEIFPGDFAPRKSLSNTSIGLVEEEEDFELTAKGLNVDTNQKNLLLFSPLTLRLLSQNDEELLQDFKESRYFEYMNGFENKLGNKPVSVIATVGYMIEFLTLMLNSGFFNLLSREFVVWRMGLFLGFVFWIKCQNFLLRANFIKKMTCILFSLWIFTIDMNEGRNEIRGFSEIMKFFAVFIFSNFSYISFLDSVFMNLLSLCLYFFSGIGLSDEKKLFVFISTIFILYRSYHNNLCRLNQFNYSLINKQKKSQQNDLLMHLLPNHIFKKFMANPSSKSELIDEFEDVTMLFADIKGFTEFSAKKSASDVVNMLRDLFTEFDKLCLKNNVYKLYTIGDCYVVLGMIDGEKRDSIAEEAKNIIYMAFSMIDTIRLVRKKINYNGLDMRIGIHTGKIIGGIIGTDIVRYDIYGKDVLIANKMESNGKEGHIMVSETTKNLLEVYYRNFFSFEHYKDVVIPSMERSMAGYFIYPNSSMF